MKNIICFIILVSSLAFAQQHSKITRLFEKDGLDIHFIFYSYGNGIEDNGVVIFLKNKNDYSISYSFRLIFRSGKVDKTSKVTGKLKALEKRTGSKDGLYFIPYKDKRKITDVGISAVKVDKLIE